MYKIEDIDKTSAAAGLLAAASLAALLLAGVPLAPGAGGRGCGVACDPWTLIVTNPAGSSKILYS